MSLKFTLAWLCLVLSTCCYAADEYSLSDTTKIVTYSFIHQSTNDSHFERLILCQGGDLHLLAPFQSNEASYEWKGPNGFTSYASSIHIENVGFERNGVYNVSIDHETEHIEAQILVEVKERPKYTVVKLDIEGKRRYKVVTSIDNASFTWKNELGDKIGEEAWFLGTQKPAQVVIAKAGCEVIQKI